MNTILGGALAASLLSLATPVSAQEFAGSSDAGFTYNSVMNARTAPAAQTTSTAGSGDSATTYRAVLDAKYGSPNPAVPAAAIGVPGPVVIKNLSSAPGGPDGNYPGFVVISFENESDAAAKSVEFQVSDRAGDQTLINDVGTFSQGALTTHTFRIWDASSDENVQVAKVRFADGSTWENQAPAPVQPRRQASADESLSTLFNETY